MSFESNKALFAALYCYEFSIGIFYIYREKKQ